MSIYKKFGISLLSFSFLAWFVFQPLNDVGRFKPYYQMPETPHEISHKELDDFLSVWAKIMHSSFKQLVNIKPLKSDRKYPKELQTWLALQHWDLERFFYDEQRIRELLEYIEIKNQLSDNKKIAKTSHINLSEINGELQKRLSTNTYSENELNLIETNIYQITEILNGKAILEK